MQMTTTTSTAATPMKTTSKLVDITSIKVGPRFRKDLGNIEDLVKSIAEIGLLHPIVINSNNELIAGQRRLEAVKKLGWNEVHCTIVNIPEIIKGEFHENTVRKDFTFSERQAILEEIGSKRIGHRVSKDKVSNLQTFQQDNKGKPSVNIVADYTGVSSRQLAKEKTIFFIFYFIRI